MVILIEGITVDRDLKEDEEGIENGGERRNRVRERGGGEKEWERER